MPKWQRKLGAPKAEEMFEDLFNRARTVEKRDEQYSQSAADNHKKSSVNASKPEYQSKSDSEKSGGESAPPKLSKVNCVL